MYMSKTTLTNFAATKKLKNVVTKEEKVGFNFRQEKPTRPRF